MEAKVLAIFDNDARYTMKLLEVFCEKKFGFQIHAFSDLEELERYIRRTEVEILLISGKCMREEFSQYPIGKIILLSDGEVSEAFSDYETIYKYQAAEYIMKEILCYYAEYARPMTGMYFRKKEFEIHGVFSPIGRCGKSALAECLAKTFGKDRKTLLLDLQSFGAWEEQLSDEELWDLTDIIYFLRQGKQTFLYKLGSIVKNMDGYDYILPMKCVGDIRSVTVAEWIELLEKLKEESEYRVVVIDFGTDVSGLFQLLEYCTKIYMPVLQDEISRKKVNHLSWMLREDEFENIIPIIQQIVLPEKFDQRDAGTVMEAWAERFVKL